MSQTTKQDFANYLHSQQGVDAYFGSDKINAWANGQIASVNYDMLYNLYIQGNTVVVNNWLNAHTSGVTKNPTPGFSDAQKVEDYTAEINFFQNQVTTITNDLTSYVLGQNPDPEAITVIQGQLASALNALKTYQGYQANAQQFLKKNS